MRRNPVLWASFRSLRLVPVLLGLSLFLAVSPADASGQRLVNGLDVSAPAAPRTTGQVESVRQEDGSVRLLVRLSIDIPVQVLARNISTDTVQVRSEDGTLVQVAPGGEVSVYRGIPGQAAAIPVHVLGPDDDWKVNVVVRRPHQ